MAIKVFPVNSVNNEPLYDAKDFRLPFKNFFTNGIFLIPNDPINSYSFYTTAKTGTTITIKKGTAFINGLIFQMDTDIDVVLDIGDSLARRYDTLVIQIDETLRKGTIKVKKGIASNTPIPPEPTRNNDLYELAIAQIHFNVGVTSLKQSDIIDVRTRNDLCGIVHGAVEQVDTETFFQQYQTALLDQRTSQQNEFNTFMNNYKNIIQSVDPGGTLLNELIAAREEEIDLRTNISKKASKVYVDAELAKKVNNAVTEHVGSITLSSNRILSSGGVANSIKKSSNGLVVLNLDITSRDSTVNAITTEVLVTLPQQVRPSNSIRFNGVVHRYSGGEYQRQGILAVLSTDGTIKVYLNGTGFGAVAIVTLSVSYYI